MSRTPSGTMEKPTVVQATTYLDEQMADVRITDSADCSEDDASSSSRRSSRRVSFSPTPPDMIATAPWCSLGITDEQVAEGKACARALRFQYPGLPKFSYYDDEAEAAIAERAANEARRKVVQTLQLYDKPVEPENAVRISPCTTGRRSRGSYHCYTTSALAAAAAAATAAVAKWQSSASGIEAKRCDLHRAAISSERWVQQTPGLNLKRRNHSVDLSVSRIQRYDSVRDARVRCIAAGPAAAVESMVVEPMVVS